MTCSELIAIGTELLLGEIQDTNTRYLARHLRDIGVDVYRTLIIGDNPARIADQIRESFSKTDIIITTGGLGPTVDDPTRDAIAQALGVKLEYRPELWTEISDRFHNRGMQPSENNKKQAYIPEGSTIIHNPVGTAPCFWMIKNNKIIISLPGVPAEMQTIFHESVVPLLQEKFSLNEMIETKVLHVACLGESVIDNLIGEMEKLTNPTVGLNAHPGLVDIRITAKGSPSNTPASLIQPVENQIRALLPDIIYGENGETLPTVIQRILDERNLHVSLFFVNFSPEFHAKFPLSDFQSIQIFTAPSLQTENPDMIHCKDFDLGFRFSLDNRQTPFLLEMKLFFSDNCIRDQRKYLGPDQQIELWMLNSILCFIWKMIKPKTFGEQND